MAPSLSASIHLSKELYEELGALIQGDVHLRDDPNFADYTQTFNGNVTTSAKAVTCPLNAKDVSQILLFCTKHSLSPSVKAGGYGTAGWAINGDIIIDLSKIVDIDIEPPQKGGSFTSLRDMVAPGSKGKGKVSAPVTSISPAVNAGKRRREDDVQLRSYDTASRAVASFLHGPPLVNDGIDIPRQIIPRRLDVEAPPPSALRSASLETESSSHDSPTSEISTVATSPSPPTTMPTDKIPPPPPSFTPADPFAYLGDTQGSSTMTGFSPPASSSLSDRRLPMSFSASSGGDPFGYLSGSASSSSFPPAPPPTAVQTPNLHSSMFSSLGSGVSTLFSNPSLPALPHGLVTHAEPIHPHAYVTFGAGMRQKEIDRYTAANPLEATSLSGMPTVIPYHVPFSAHPVGSSIMMLGGFGFLGRLYGLSIDNLVEVEMVLSDGEIVIVNEHEHPELWWALRGAGPAFGIATRYKARAYPVPVVFAGNLLYRFHRATAPSLIKHFRDCVKGAPRELYANVILTAGPADQDSLIVIQICYIGPKEKGQEYLQAISSWDGEGCLLNEVDEKSFLHQQDSVAQVLRGKAGRQWFIRSALITSLPDDIINTTVLQFADTPVGCTWLFELAGGAIADFEDTCLPKAQREAAFTIAALHQWDMGVDDPRCVESAEDWIANTLAPVNTGGPLPCFLGRHEPASRTISCFGNNWSRLAELKKKYDPKGLFRNTLWPLDTEGNSIDPEAHEPPSP